MGWIRQSDLDANGKSTPIPTRIASNEEFIPPPQSAEQREVELRFWAMAERAAARLNLTRRDFIRSSLGFTAAMLAMNQVFGKVYAVDDDELVNADKVKEKWPKDQFIFDVQTHHVDVDQEWYDNTEEGAAFKRFARLIRPGSSIESSVEKLNRDHYIKELFFDSDTVMAIISGVPTREWNSNILPPDKMAGTRDYVNKLANSQRMLSHGLLRPNMGRSELDEMQRQVEELKISAWKCYTGAELDKGGWWLDDQMVAYPFWERTQELGVKNVCVHKGLPLGMFNEDHCRPKDIEQAAKDFPGINFIIYHSGFRGIWGGGGRSDDPQYIPWIGDIIEMLKKNPEVKNVYFELGSTFNQLSSFSPTACLHMLGQMIQVAGADHIVWGTDAIWGGSPQSQIARLRRMKMKPELMEKHGYPELTDEIKDQIFGLNAARLFGLDPKEKRQAMERDKISMLKQDYQRDPEPSYAQFGWVWEGGPEPTVPIGE